MLLFKRQPLTSLSNRKRYLLKNSKAYIITNEVFNAVTHGIGFGFAVAGLILLILNTWNRQLQHLWHNTCPTLSLLHLVPQSHFHKGQSSLPSIWPFLDLSFDRGHLHALLFDHTQRLVRLDLVWHCLGLCHHRCRPQICLSSQMGSRPTPLNRLIRHHGLAHRLCLETALGCPATCWRLATLCWWCPLYLWCLLLLAQIPLRPCCLAFICHGSCRPHVDFCL